MNIIRMFGLVMLLLVLTFSSAVASDFNGHYISKFAENSQSTEDAIINCAAYNETLCLFKIQPPDEEVWHISRLIISLEDSGTMANDEYGNLGSALTNGLVIYYINDNGTQYNLTNSQPIKTNADFAKFSYDSRVINWGGNQNTIDTRWSFDKGGTILQLNGSINESLAIKLNDNFIGLQGHTFLFQGHVFNKTLASQNINLETSDIDFTMTLSVIVGLLAMFGVLAYYGTAFFRMRPIGYKVMGMMINSIASFIVIVISYVLLETSVGTTYEGVMAIVFQITWILITIGNTAAYIMIMIVGAHEPIKIAEEIHQKIKNSK